MDQDNPEMAKEPAEGSVDGQNGPDEAEHRQHDLIFKTVFHHFFADLIELAEPEFASRVDLADIEFLEQEAFSDFPAGLRREADLVAKLKALGGEGRVVLVQTEVSDQFRTSMDKRGFEYYVFLRAKYGVPVLLIVISLKGGEKGLEVREYFDHAESFEACRFRYVAFSLGQNKAEKFVDLPQPLAPSLAALMKSNWDPVEKKLRCLKAIGGAEIDEARRFLLASVVDLYVELDEVEVERFTAEIEKEGNKEIQKMVITWEETLADREARGKSEGKSEGKAEGLVDAILRVLKQRLKIVPDFVRQKLAAIRSAERLEEILDQALVVSSVDDLVLEP